MQTDRNSIRKLLLRWAPPLILLLLFAVFVVRINMVDKTELVSREGQTFEKGVVTEILQDNLQPDGTRVGEQRVRVQMFADCQDDCKGSVSECGSGRGHCSWPRPWAYAFWARR